MTATMAIGTPGIQAGRNDRAQAGAGGVPVTAACRRGRSVNSSASSGGTGLQGAAGPVFQFLGGEAAGLEVLAELGDGPVAVGVGHPQTAGRVVHGDGIHDENATDQRAPGHRPLAGVREINPWVDPPRRVVNPTAWLRRTRLPCGPEFLLAVLASAECACVLRAHLRFGYLAGTSGGRA